jgi:hypothetical protein
MLQSFNVKDAPPKPDDWQGEWRCVDYDPVEQISEWYLYDENQGKPVVHIRRIQHNMEQMLADNQAEYNAQLNDRWGDGKKVAHIPMAIWHGLGMEEAMAEGNNGYIHRILNDPDYKKLRTFKGKI